MTQPSSSQIVWTSTESGTIALFEPERVPFEDLFSAEPYTYLTYMREGKLVLVSIGGDGSEGMLVEVANSEPRLQPNSIKGRLEVISGKLYFCPGESLPDEGEDFEEIPGKGTWIEIPTGKYRYELSPMEHPDGVSLHLTLHTVRSFDGLPYHKGAEMPDIEA